MKHVVVKLTIDIELIPHFDNIVSQRNGGYSLYTTYKHIQEFKEIQ